MRQNVVFLTKKIQKNLGRGLQTLRLSGEEDTPAPQPPFGTCGTSTPPILNSWVRHCGNVNVKVDVSSEFV